MYGIAFLLVTGFFVYRAHRKRRATRPQSTPHVTTGAETLGEAGEAAVDADLRRVLKWLCGENFHLHPGAVLLHHAPGAEYPTAEIDHLAITPFGLFMFETKNWAGKIEPGPDDDTLTRIAPNGTRDVRRSPARQSRAKLAFLRSVMPAMWPVHAFGVFASRTCSISPVLPLSLIRLDDIGHQLRVCKAQYEAAGRRPVNVAAAWRAVQSVAETEPAAIAAHRIRIRTGPIFKLSIS